MNRTKGDIIAMSLMSGIDIIGVFVEETESTVIIEKLLSLRMVQDSPESPPRPALVPPTMLQQLQAGLSGKHVSDVVRHQIPVNKLAIMFHDIPVAKEIRDIFMQETSGIQIATGNAAGLRPVKA